MSKLIFSAVLVALSGCASKQEVWPNNPPTGAFYKIEGVGIDNLYALGAGIFSGSSPEGEAGFATLQKLGVKTVISVDGAMPDADLAAQHGIRYIHLPIGYDGTSHSNALQIVKAAQVSPGLVFVHCHHGKHRGPAAAALICEGIEGWSPEQAEAWMHAAGTATNYPGLYRTVREFHATERELRAVRTKFPARAQTPKLVQTMVQVDDHFDVLKTMEKAGFNKLPEHPDATPENESLILWELFREAHRTGQGAERGAAFQRDLARAESAAADLHARLKELGENPSVTARETGAASLHTMAGACAACHKAHRD